MESRPLIGEKAKLPGLCLTQAAGHAEDAVSNATRGRSPAELVKGQNYNALAMMCALSGMLGRKDGCGTRQPAGGRSNQTKSPAVP